MADHMEGFWASLTPEEQDALTAVGARRRYARGRTVFLEQSASDHVLVVLSGRFKVSSHTADGREVVLAVRGPGDLVGELSAIDQQPRSASVAALESAEALVVPSHAFQDYLQKQPRVAVLLIQTITSRLRDADRKRIEYGAHDTAGRVALRLVELAERFGEPEDDGIAIDLPLSQEELAGWTGSSREAVSKALRALRDRGWISTHRRRIVVRDLEALRNRGA